MERADLHSKAQKYVIPNTCSILQSQIAPWQLTLLPASFALDWYMFILICINIIILESPWLNLNLLFCLDSFTGPQLRALRVHVAGGQFGGVARGIHLVPEFIAALRLQIHPVHQKIRPGAKIHPDVAVPILINSGIRLEWTYPMAKKIIMFFSNGLYLQAPYGSIWPKSLS